MEKEGGLNDFIHNMAGNRRGEEEFSASPPRMLRIAGRQAEYTVSKLEAHSASSMLLCECGETPENRALTCL